VIVHSPSSSDERWSVGSDDVDDDNVVKPSKFASWVESDHLRTVTAVQVDRISKL
jgi:hypothetical protein